VPLLLWVDSHYVVCAECGELFCPVEVVKRPYLCLSCRVVVDAED